MDYLARGGRILSAQDYGVVATYIGIIALSIWISDLHRLAWYTFRAWRRRRHYRKVLDHLRATDPEFAARCEEVERQSIETEFERSRRIARLEETLWVADAIDPIGEEQIGYAQQPRDAA